MRDDGRLGAPEATALALGDGDELTDAPLDHVCPICEGAGDHHGHCLCGGLGVVTADRSSEVAQGDPDPRWTPRPLPPVPPYTGRRCGDCAFKASSLERDGTTARALFDRHNRGLAGMPFWCHAGMHDGDRGYVPRQRATGGAPLGHPVCAGWVKEYERAASEAADRDVIDVDMLPCRR